VLLQLILLCRTLKHPLLRLKKEGYSLVGLEQTSNSSPLFGFEFPRKTVIVVGNEAKGIPEDILELLDAVVEIPVYGLPYRCAVYPLHSLS